MLAVDPVKFNKPYLLSANELIVDFGGKCKQAAARYARGDKDLFEDLLQSGYETLLWCAKRFDPVKSGGDTYGCFYAYAALAIDRKARDEYFSLTTGKARTRGKRSSNETAGITFLDDDALDLFEAPDPSPEETVIKTERERLVVNLVEIALNALDEQHRFVIEAKFGILTGKPVKGKALEALYASRFGKKLTKLESMVKRAYRLMRAALERAGYGKYAEAITALF